LLAAAAGAGAVAGSCAARSCGARCGRHAAVDTFVLRAEFGQQRQIQLFGQLFDFTGAVGQRDRQHASIAQAIQQRLRGGDLGGLRQPAEIDDHRRAAEQFGRALDPLAHFADQLRYVQRADAQVGNAHLADFQFAGLFVIEIR
jgi:hypothetical protein